MNKSHFWDYKEKKSGKIGQISISDNSMYISIR